MSDKIDKSFYSEKSSDFSDTIISLKEGKDEAKELINESKQTLKELKQELKNIKIQIFQICQLISTQKGRVRKINFQLFNTKRLSKKLTKEYISGRETNLKKYTK